MNRAAGALIALVMVTVVLAGCTTTDKTAAASRADASAGYRGAYLQHPYTMPDLVLSDTSGAAYNLATSPSKPVTLLFFGYTHCPDVCSGVLSDVAMALSRLSAADRDQVQLLFVTTDPARDTRAATAAYLGRFDPSFIGLTGDLGTIKNVAERVGVEIEGTQKLADGGYDVAHSAQVIGFDRLGHGIVVWTPGTPIADLMHDFDLLVSRQQR